MAKKKSKSKKDTPEVEDKSKKVEKVAEDIIIRSVKPLLIAVVVLFVITIILIIAQSGKDEDIAVAAKHQAILDEAVLNLETGRLAELKTEDEISGQLDKLNKVAKEAPDSQAATDATYFEARLLFAKKEYEKAADLFVKYAKENPERKPLADIAIYNAASAQINLKRYDAATKILDDAITRGGNEMTIDSFRYQKAIVALLQKKGKDAAKLLEELSQKTDDEGNKTAIAHQSVRLLELVKEARRHNADLSNLNQSFPKLVETEDEAPADEKKDEKEEAKDTKS